jgi:hypothetical protein
MAIDVQQNGAIEFLVNNVVLEDLVVEGLGSALGDRHLECGVSRLRDLMGWVLPKEQG